MSCFLLQSHNTNPSNALLDQSITSNFAENKSKPTIEPQTIFQANVVVPENSLSRTPITSSVTTTRNPNSLSKRIYQAAYPYAALEQAIKNSDLFTVQKLLRKGCTLDSPQRLEKGVLPSLVLALENGVTPATVAMAQALINYGAKSHVIFTRPASLRPSFFSSCYEPFPSTTSLMGYYAEKGDMERFEALLNLGVPCILDDSEGRKPHDILINNYEKAVLPEEKSLWQAMLLVLQQTMQNRTRPLRDAIEMRDKEALEDLIKQTPIEILEECYLIAWGEPLIITALKGPVSKEMKEFAQLLVSLKVNLKGRISFEDSDQHFTTSLVGYYVEKEDVEKLRILLALDAPLSIEDSTGKNPIAKTLEKLQSGRKEDPRLQTIHNLLHIKKCQSQLPLDTVVKIIYESDHRREIRAHKQNAKDRILNNRSSHYYTFTRIDEFFPSPGEKAFSFISKKLKSKTSPLSDGKRRIFEDICGLIYQECSQVTHLGARPHQTSPKPKINSLLTIEELEDPSKNKGSDE